MVNFSGHKGKWYNLPLCQGNGLKERAWNENDFKGRNDVFLGL
jgi:hypothetical protein